jgi:hypothetical protein
VALGLWLTWGRKGEGYGIEEKRGAKNGWKRRRNEISKVANFCFLLIRTNGLLEDGWDN